MVHFVGAGCGAPDLITLRGDRFIREADVIIYAGSLVNPALLEHAKSGCQIHNSAYMTLDEVIAVILDAEEKGLMTVRLHTGDPSIYGAIREQMDELNKHGIAYDVCPGVSAWAGAAAALNLEYTLPGISQSVIITRMEGRTPMPSHQSIQEYASHRATMAIFLSAGMTEKLGKALMEGGYPKETPAAIVYKASWPDEERYICTIETLHETAKLHGISKTALIIVGDVIGALAGEQGYDLSRLYAPDFSTEYRTAHVTGNEK